MFLKSTGFKIFAKINIVQVILALTLQATLSSFQTFQVVNM